MYDREIPHRQLTAWLAAALIPTAIQLTAGSSWVKVLLVGVIALMLVWLRWALGAEPRGKLLVIGQFLLLTVVLGTACQASVQSWPKGGHPVTAIILLVLALWSVRKGISAAARVGCVLFWFVLGLYLVLLGAGVKDMELRWLIPTEFAARKEGLRTVTGADVNGFGCVLLLTPAAAAIHLNRRENIKPRLLMIGVFTTVAAVVTAGVLSPQVSAERENAFYEMTRSLNLLGQARRFEAVLSAGMTAAWFTLLSLYLSLCFRLAENIHPGWGNRGSLAAATGAAVILLCELHIPGLLLLLFTAVFWVLIPLLTQGLGLEKKS